MDSILDAMIEDNEIQRKIDEAGRRLKEELDKKKANIGEKSESLRILPEEMDHPKCSMVFDSPANACFQAISSICTYEKKYGPGSYLDACLANYGAGKDSIIPEEVQVVDFSGHDWNVKPNVDTVVTNELLKIPKYEMYSWCYDNLGSTVAIMYAGASDYYRSLRYQYENSSAGKRIFLVSGGNDNVGILDTWIEKEKLKVEKTSLGWKHPNWEIYLTSDYAVLDSCDGVYVGERFEIYCRNKSMVETLRNLIQGKLVCGVFQRSENNLNDTPLDLLWNGRNDDFIYEYVKDSSGKTYTRFKYDLESLLTFHDVDWIDPSLFIKYEKNILRATVFLYVAVPKQHCARYKIEQIDKKTDGAYWILNPDINVVTKDDVTRGESPGWFKSSKEDVITGQNDIWIIVERTHDQWYIEDVMGRYKRKLILDTTRDVPFRDMKFLGRYDPMKNCIKLLTRVADHTVMSTVTWYSLVSFASAFSKLIGADKFNFFPIDRCTVDTWYDFVLLPMPRLCVSKHDWLMYTTQLLTMKVCRSQNYTSDTIDNYNKRFKLHPSTPEAMEANYHSADKRYVFYEPLTGKKYAYDKYGLPWKDIQALIMERGVATPEQYLHALMTSVKQEKDDKSCRIYVDLDAVDKGNYSHVVTEKFLLSYPKKVEFVDKKTSKVLTLLSHNKLYTQALSLRSRMIRTGRYMYYDKGQKEITHFYYYYMLFQTIWTKMKDVKLSSAFWESAYETSVNIQTVERGESEDVVVDDSGSYEDMLSKASWLQINTASQDETYVQEWERDYEDTEGMFKDVWDRQEGRCVNEDDDHSYWNANSADA